MVVVEVSPKIVLSSFGFDPVPGPFDFQVGAVHIGHVPSVGELGELGFSAEGRLAEIVSYLVTGDLDSSDGVSDCDDASSPTLIERLVGVIVWGEVGVVIIERAVVGPRSDNAGDGQLLSAGSISKLWVAPITRHSADEAVGLLGPNRGLEGQSLLIGVSLSIVREVFYDGVRRRVRAEGCGHEQAHEKANLGC